MIPLKRCYDSFFYFFLYNNAYKEWSKTWCETGYNMYYYLSFWLQIGNYLYCSIQKKNYFWPILGWNTAMKTGTVKLNSQIAPNLIDIPSLG
jgi:hypothetical protein